MRSIRTVAGAIVGITISISTLAGCGGAGTPTAQKAGAPDQELRIVMVDSQPPDSPTSLAMDAFAAELKDRSGGSIIVETRSGGEYADNAGDAKVVDALKAGEVDMAMVPTRAWSDAGVASAEVLQTPFEVMSNAHMVAVAQDEDLTEKALADLAASGAHGLVVVPERLRLLFAEGTPIRRPADLTDRTMRSISPSIGKILEEMGATAVNPTDEDYAAMRTDGTIGGAESDWVRGISIAAGSTATSDLVLYAKFVSIAANLDWWEGLTDEQRQALTDAAVATREISAGSLSDPAMDAGRYCVAGGKIVSVGEPGLDQFRESAKSITNAVDQDALAQLRALRPTSEDKAPQACAAVATALDPSNVTPEAGDLPDGVYRFEATPDFATNWNAEAGPDDVLFEGDLDPASLERVQVTWTLKGGQYTFEIVVNDEEPFTREGVYQVEGDQVLLALGPEIGNVVNRLTWRVEDDGSLVLTQVDGLASDWYYGQPWTRIGDA